jgi:hypothetical protein
MPVQITNVSPSLVTVPLNSGESIHLAPKERSGTIDDVEVADNQWLEELQRRRLVAVHPTGTGVERGESARTRGGRAARTP